MDVLLSLAEIRSSRNLSVDQGELQPDLRISWQRLLTSCLTGKRCIHETLFMSRHSRRARARKATGIRIHRRECVPADKILEECGGCLTKRVRKITYRRYFGYGFLKIIK